MANYKTGFSYYSVDTDRYSDISIKRLKKSFGCPGIAVYDYILCEIYRDKGCFLAWDDNRVFDISDFFNLEESIVVDIVNFCCVCNLFNTKIFMAESVLTSEDIQNRYINMCNAAKRKQLFIPKKYFIDPEDTDIVPEVSHIVPEVSHIVPEVSHIVPGSLRIDLEVCDKVSKVSKESKVNKESKLKEKPLLFFNKYNSTQKLTKIKQSEKNMIMILELVEKYDLGLLEKLIDYVDQKESLNGSKKFLASFNWIFENCENLFLEMEKFLKKEEEDKIKFENEKRNKQLIQEQKEEENRKRIESANRSVPMPQDMADRLLRKRIK